MVHHRGFETQTLWSIFAIFAVGRIVGSFVDGEIINLTVIALIEKENTARQLVHNDIPREDTARARHEVSQDRVGDKDLSHTIDGQFFHDGIVRRRNIVKVLLLHWLECNGLTGGDLVVGIIVGIQISAPEQIIGRRDITGSGNILGKLGEINFIHLIPIVTDGHGRLSIHAVVVRSTPTAATATATATSAAAATARHFIHLGTRRSTRRLLTTGINLTQSQSLLASFIGRIHESLRCLYLGRIDELETIFGIFVGRVINRQATVLVMTTTVTTASHGSRTTSHRTIRIGKVRRTA